jgi:hypothetical protein
MANTETLVVKSAKASIDASTGLVNQPITGLIAGEAIANCDIVYIKGSDGLVYRTTAAAAANEAARMAGIAPRAANAGEPITILPGPGQVAKYSDALLTPGAILFLAEGAGALSTTATTGDAVGVAQAIDSSNIRLTRGI